MRRAPYLVLGLAALGWPWAACGGTVEPGETELPGADAAPDAKKDSSKDALPHKDAAKDAGKDALPDYNDPGCPDAPPPIVDNQCDPMKPAPGDCLSGEACYPYVVYPTEPCDAEIYGAMCSSAGTGEQGDPCYGEQCAPQHVCVITGGGTQCVLMCDLDKLNSCPDGLVCEAIDVLGYGGCL